MRSRRSFALNVPSNRKNPSVLRRVARDGSIVRNLLFALASRRSLTIMRDGSMIIMLPGRMRGTGGAVNAANGDVLLVAQFHQCAIIGCGEPRCNCSIREQLDYRMFASENSNQQ